ncbi:MAG: hypothetical protein QNK05_20390 [Myxococcota bacterium]|nr:hypothetical protein [Myxococcota bacterium]
MLVDAIALGSGHTGLRMLNYACVWLAVHQLGYAWRDGLLGGVGRSLAGLACAAVALAALIAAGPYPLSMVGVPGAAISNSQPPTLALLVFGMAQISLALLVEAPARRWLARRRVWAATVLVNGQIMTLYLWHMTALVIVLGGAVALGGIGLETPIASADWWLARPLWLGIYLLATLPFLIGLARFERPARETGERSPVSRRRLVTGATLACVGLFAVAKAGIAGAGPSGASLRIVPALLPFVGSGLAAFGPLGRLGSLPSRTR